MHACIHVMYGLMLARTVGSIARVNEGQVSVSNTLAVSDYPPPLLPSSLVNNSGRFSASLCLLAWLESHWKLLSQFKATVSNKIA
jgi:hypothetical protein